MFFFMIARFYFYKPGHQWVYVQSGRPMWLREKWPKWPGYVGWPNLVAMLICVHTLAYINCLWLLLDNFCNAFYGVLMPIQWSLTSIWYQNSCSIWICKNLPSTCKIHIKQLHVFNMVELQLQVDNAVYLLGISLIIRIIKEVNSVGLWIRVTGLQSQWFLLFHLCAYGGFSKIQSQIFEVCDCVILAQSNQNTVIVQLILPHILSRIRRYISIIIFKDA